jgi:hypothetical protein
MNAHEKLIAAIQEKDPSPLREEMLKHVKAFEYHDFKSDKTFPKIQLVVDLNLLGYEDIAMRAMDGEFDNSLDE